jgi:hypothetical protein
MAYRTRVRIVEAFRWTGQPRVEWPAWAALPLLSESGSALYAYTHNGPVRVNRGDWCICGEKEIYPCTDEEFHKRYEAWMAPVQQTISQTTARDHNFESSTDGGASG